MNHKLTLQTLHIAPTALALCSFDPFALSASLSEGHYSPPPNQRDCSAPSRTVPSPSHPSNIHKRHSLVALLID